MASRDKKSPQGSVVLKTRSERKTARPRMFRVLIHNDDYTPMEFVVRLLEVVFHRNEADATAIMLHIHNHARDRGDEGRPGTHAGSPARLPARRFNGARGGPRC